MTSSIIYEDDEILVIHQPAPARKDKAAEAPALTLVTFADLTFRPDGMAIWGRDPARKLGLPAIGFVAKRENWFPAASVARAAPAVRALLNGPAMTYGYSMGGYAALKYARLLGISRALAVCPQASIDPVDVPTDKRFHKFFDRALHDGMRMTPEEAPEFGVLMADPYMVDDKISAELFVQSGAHWLRTPFMDHATIWLLVDTDFLHQTLQQVMAAELPALSALIRGRRHSSSQWFFRVGMSAFRRGRYHLAGRLLDRAEQLGLHRTVREQEIMRTLRDTVHRMLSRGQANEAQSMVRHLVEEHGKDPVVLAQIGHILVGMGQATLAEEPFRASLALRKDISHVYRGLSIVLGAKGRKDEALKITAQGIREAPGDAGLHIHYGFGLLNAAKLEEAEAQFDTVLGQDPDHVGAIIGKSHVLGAYGRQADAIEVVKRAIALEPENAGNHTWLGQLLLVVGQPAEAEPHFRVAIVHQPQLGAAHIGLARSLERTGRLDEARHVAQDAAAALPNDARVQAIHRRMGPPLGPPPDAQDDVLDNRSRFRRFISAFFSAS
ncbi:tetratricopeptide repeat protein [Acetobacteraceae bacterium AT-5844]|nr:tetratricopeptide repeat protein [Acetobacteraceae bacterium AT-5844]